MSDNPYNQKVINNKIIRTFEKNVLSLHLIWHRDKQDRYVKILEGVDWQLQFDNRMPEKLVVGKIYYIPRMMYHRIIKGTKDLVLEIEEK
jgi:hypothetical protein